MQSVPIATQVVCSNPARGLSFAYAGRLFSLVSSTIKTYHYVITEILLKVALSTITIIIKEKTVCTFWILIRVINSIISLLRFILLSLSS
jgi:hypothetical protein